MTRSAQASIHQRLDRSAEKTGRRDPYAVLFELGQELDEIWTATDGDEDAESVDTEDREACQSLYEEFYTRNRDSSAPSASGFP